MSNKILFFGNERLATGLSTTTPTLRALIDNGYDVTGVVVAQNELGQSRKARQLEIVQVAQEHSIPVISPDDLTQARDELAAFGAEAGVLVAYGKIVPDNIIGLFPRGIINIHPSLLPRHRGSIPIESVILAGENETGVSLMQLAPEMDAGPLYAQQQVALDGSETKAELTEKLQALGAELLVEHLPAILDGSLQPTSQDGQASYDDRIDKSAGQLDFNKPALQLEREVRAYAGWPRSRTKLGDTDIIVTQAHLETGSGTPGQLWIQDKQLGFYTAEGILAIDELIPAGKKAMPIVAFLAGYKL